jgi:hypothetical protein
MMEKCRFCGKAISFAYKEWWDEQDDNACGEGKHAPYVRVELPPTSAFQTMGPVAKWRENGSGRLVPLGKPPKKGRKLTL